MNSPFLYKPELNIAHRGCQNETETLFQKPVSSVLPSCDPGRFRLGKLEVIRWGSRKIPCRRNIPSHRKLGILSRGRIRLPHRNLESFITRQRSFHRSKGDRNAWLLRTGHRESFASLTPEIDTTFELFILQKDLSPDEITNIFEKYLQQRVQTELKGCGFYLFDWRVATKKAKESMERELGLLDFDVNLDRLYQRANVKLAGRSCSKKTGESIGRFVLFTYMTFSSELSSYLLPPVFPKRKEYTGEEAKAVRRAAEKLLGKGSAAEKELGCVLKMTLRKDVRDEWISRHRLAWYLHANKSKTKGLSPVGVHARSLRAEIINVFKRSKDFDDFLKRLFFKDDGSPIRHPNVYIPRVTDIWGGPVLQDFMGAHNIVVYRLNQSYSNHEPFEHHCYKVFEWMKDRAARRPFGYYKCLIV